MTRDNSHNERSHLPTLAFRIKPVPHEKAEDLWKAIIALDYPGEITFVGSQISIYRDKNAKTDGEGKYSKNEGFLGGYFLEIHWVYDADDEELDQHQQFYRCFTSIHDYLFDRNMLLEKVE